MTAMKSYRRSALPTAIAILALSAPVPAGADKAPYETSEIRQSYLFSVAVS